MRLTETKKRQYIQSPFKKGKITCQICGRTDRYHCSVTVDGSLAVCKYKWSDQHAKDGRYIHILNPNNSTALYVGAPSVQKTEPKKADAKTCDAVYMALLSYLKLNPEHANALLNERGLSDTTIANRLYASVPDKARGHRLARALARFFDLRGVPGFYYQDGRWQLNVSFKGFYVPYRDEYGRIVGLQIRRDGNQEPKYLWLSSADKLEGASPGAPLHFSKPDLTEQSGEVIVTEGALKADRISEFAYVATVALAGVTAMNPEKFTARIKHGLPKLRSVLIGFDIDWQEKPEVKAALFRLKHTLEKTDLAVKIRTWSSSLGKGLDDVLFQVGG
ncbi:MAG TPA: DUF3854 domain-containing protein [Pyrinomonadaceae bacterium]|nr:DUF3854 domain-containing protein [Pyrinomonadaceae bacterium]